MTTTHANNKHYRTQNHTRGNTIHKGSAPCPSITLAAAGPCGDAAEADRACPCPVPCANPGLAPTSGVAAGAHNLALASVYEVETLTNLMHIPIASGRASDV